MKQRKIVGGRESITFHIDKTLLKCSPERILIAMSGFQIVDPRWQGSRLEKLTFTQNEIRDPLTITLIVIARGRMSELYAVRHSILSRSSASSADEIPGVILSLLRLPFRRSDAKFSVIKSSDRHLESSTWEQRMPKQVIYRFNANPQNDKVELDMDDEISEPLRGDVLEIDGKQWKVNAVMTGQSLSAKGPIPVVTIYLTDN